MSIGITRYSAKKFALINFISALIWATITILLAWYFGNLIEKLLDWARHHWYYALILIVAFLSLLLFSFKQMEKAILKNKKEYG